MRTKKRVRRQRVVLRAKRRVVLGQRLRYLFVGSALSGLVVFGLTMLSRGDAWAPQFMKRHTPVLQIEAPETLAGLPLLKETHPGHFVLWFPGAEWRLKGRWMKENPAVSAVRFDKRFTDNRIVVHLEPRVPLVHMDTRGVDKDGIIFALASDRWTPLPKAVLPETASYPMLGRWLAEVSRQTEFWGHVVAVSEDARGDMWLDMGTGTRVAWGAPDVHKALDKIRCLTRVLEDAHQRLSGAATADMRFFDEGRIIIRPKSAV